MRRQTVILNDASAKPWCCVQQVCRVVAEIQTRAAMVLALYMHNADFAKLYISQCGSSLDMLKTLAKDCSTGKTWLRLVKLFYWCLVCLFDCNSCSQFRCNESLKYLFRSARKKFCDATEWGFLTSSLGIILPPNSWMQCLLSCILLTQVLVSFILRMPSSFLCFIFVVLMQTHGTFVQVVLGALSICFVCVQGVGPRWWSPTVRDYACCTETVPSLPLPPAKQTPDRWV